MDMGSHLKTFNHSLTTPGPHSLYRHGRPKSTLCSLVQTWYRCIPWSCILVWGVMFPVYRLANDVLSKWKTSSSFLVTIHMPIWPFRWKLCKAFLWVTIKGKGHSCYAKQLSAKLICQSILQCLLVDLLCLQVEVIWPTFALIFIMKCALLYTFLIGDKGWPRSEPHTHAVPLDPA